LAEQGCASSECIVDPPASLELPSVDSGHHIIVEAGSGGDRGAFVEERFQSRGAVGRPQRIPHGGERGFEDIFRGGGRRRSGGRLGHHRGGIRGGAEIGWRRA